MTNQETVIPKKRGPKPRGKDVPVVVRLQPHALEALDAWYFAQGGDFSRPEAVRRLVETGLKR